MAAFKIGDRVRIVTKVSRHFGKEGTIVDVADGYLNEKEGLGWVVTRCYVVNMDGHGIRSLAGGRLAFESRHLQPLTNPDEEAWQAFRRHLQPDPAVLGVPA